MGELLRAYAETSESRRPVTLMGSNDSFGESGTPTQLLKKYGLGLEHIVAAVEKVLKRKK